ncbi:MAG: type I DNA topoisomerase [Candidatus Tritonobacter lacicola]|nr:type I DNA topoisomerase [Candidatus Tritonobacter lacicola]
MEGYCLKCKSKRLIEDPSPVFSASGRPATRGRCPVCGGGIYRTGLTEAHEGMERPAPPAKEKGGVKKSGRKKKARKTERPRKGSLFIVESPTKARTISRYLGPDFTVRATVGHIIDLPKSKLGIDIENGFEPNYIVIKGKKKVLDEIKKAAKHAETIYLALDPDREGEAIAYHVASKLDSDQDRIFRVLLNEINRKAVAEGIKNPGRIDMRKVEAQQARRILDRLVGYKISPLLWKNLKYGLSAGRVQSVALRLICDRENEIDAFVQEEYWTMHARLATAEREEFTARLTRIDGEKAEIKCAEEAASLKAELEGQEFAVAEVKKERKVRRPYPPFRTSTLQQDAARRLYFTAKKTMVIAQQLYEGIDLGRGERAGLITYMRTDSTRIAADALGAVRTYIKSEYGDSYLPEKARFFKSPKRAQEAHEAIRPTHMGCPPAEISAFLSPDQMKLYSLIWGRFLASQMADAVFAHTSVIVGAGRFTLRASGSTPVFDGFLKVYTEVKEKKDDEEIELPPVSEGGRLDPVGVEGQQHFTKPPPRYTEASLIRELEKQGIGRPSTYASIIGKIQAREYAVKETGRFVPSPLGRKVIELLIGSFPKVMDVAFTAEMEEFLDDVEGGRKEWLSAISDFYEGFKKALDEAAENMKVTTDVKCTECGRQMVVRGGGRKQYLACEAHPQCKATRDFVYGKDGEIILLDEIKIDRACDKCGKPMVLKNSGLGPFLGCSGFPECKYTLDVEMDEDGKFIVVEPKPTGLTCPKCGAEMVEKRGRFGKFIACSNYPSCKTTMPVPTNVPCPREGCGGMLVKKRSKKRRYFYGCSRYPECDFRAPNLKNIKPE